MKRIEFIAPVEAMRGNLSRSKQGLLYADNDNPAWDAPEGKRSYARNYQPVFVGAKVSKSGRKYFSVKTKTAITITPAVKHRMALLAASSEMANVIMAHLPLQYSLQQLYMANHPTGWSWKRWVMYYVRQGLDKKITIVFPGYESLGAVFVKNPYCGTTQPSAAVDLNEYFPDELLVKFWYQLANNPGTFVLADKTGLFHVGDNFVDIIGTNYNVLDLSLSEAIGEVRYVKMEDAFVQVTDTSATPAAATYVDEDTTAKDAKADPEYVYSLTDVAPQA